MKSPIGSKAQKAVDKWLTKSDEWEEPRDTLKYAYHALVHAGLLKDSLGILEAIDALKEDDD